MRIAPWTLLLLAACAAQAPPAVDARVIPVYRGLEAFGAARIKAPRASAADAYRQFVVDRYGASCSFSSGPFQILGAEASPYEAVTVAQQIEAAGALAHAAAGLARAETALPSRAPVRLCLFAAVLDGAMFHLGGAGGVSLGNGQINLFAYPTAQGFERLRYTVAHEYHHEALRHALGGWAPDPLLALVSEGKADQFAVALYPALRPKHTLPLSDDELRRSWAAFQRLRSGDVATFRRDFMIAAQSELPLWAGYRLAFEVAGACQSSAPAAAPATLLTVPADACLRAFLATQRGRRLR